VFAASAHGPTTPLGAGMAVTAALQLVGAVALAWRARPAATAAVLALNAVAALAGVLAHTTGLPLPGLREPAPFDGQLVAVLCLEVAAVAAALAALPARAGRWLAPALAVAVLAAAVPAALAGHDHAARPHPDAAGHPAGAAHPEVAATPGHGHAGGDAGRLRYAAFTAGLTGAQVDEVLADYERWLTEHLLRSGRRGLTRGAAAAFSAKAMRHYLSAGEGNGGHGHAGPAQWQPAVDLATRDRLAVELRAARDAALRLPTAADARRAGYVLVAPYLPGVGAHYLNTGYLLDAVFDPGRPEVLLYSGNGDDARVVGASYLVAGDERRPPEGFAGPNDVFHFHDDLCLVGGLAVPAPDAAACDAVGGRTGSGFGGLTVWMNHAWVVPGWESPWGLFSGEHPDLTLAVGRPARR
jgi:hypothetical protein